MGFFDFLKKPSRFSKEQLLEWQKLVMKDKTDRLVMTESQLKSTSIGIAERDLEIISDCIRIVTDTIKPDTFFSRLELLESKSKRLALLSDYISFTGANPKDAYKEILDQKQECIRQFIVRYFGDTCDKADAMKTIKGKNNQFQRFYDSLLPYKDKMDDYNNKYIERKYEDHIKNEGC